MLKINRVNIIFRLLIVPFCLSVNADTDIDLEASTLINIIRSVDGDIFLNSRSCQQLIKQDQALRDWTRTSGETPGMISIPSKTPEENQCSLNISNSIPSLAFSLQSFKPTFNGPNCWNTVLRLSGLVQYTRYSSPDELGFWMNSSYCKELTELEKSLPGDIIAIRGISTDDSQSFDEIHGMIYLSDDLVYSKNTSSHMSAYGIQRANLVYQTFRLNNQECIKVQGRPKNCSRWANHYRCVRPEIDRTLFEIENLEFKTLASTVRRIESSLSVYVMTGSGTYKADIEITKKQLSDIELIIINKNYGALGPRFFFKVLLQEINSLKRQIEIITKQHKKINTSLFL